MVIPTYKGKGYIMNTKHIIKQYKSFQKSEFEEYFQQLGTQIGKDEYAGEGWRAKIGNEAETRLGSFKMNQIRIDLWLREDIEEGFLDSMRVKFLRGGG